MAIRDRPTVQSTIVDFARILPSPRFQRLVQLPDRLRRHALVIDGMPEIHARLDPRQLAMWAGRLVGIQPSSMEQSCRRNSVGTDSSGSHRHCPAVTESNYAYRSRFDGVTCA